MLGVDRLDMIKGIPQARARAFTAWFNLLAACRSRGVRRGQPAASTPQRPALHGALRCRRPGRGPAGRLHVSQPQSAPAKKLRPCCVARRNCWRLRSSWRSTQNGGIRWGLVARIRKPHACCQKRCLAAARHLHRLGVCTCKRHHLGIAAGLCLAAHTSVPIASPAAAALWLHLNAERKHCTSPGQPSRPPGAAGANRCALAHRCARVPALAQVGSQSMQRAAGAMQTVGRVPDRQPRRGITPAHLGRP